MDGAATGPVDDRIYRVYQHSPPHLFRGGTYFITAGIYGKRHLIGTDHRKEHWLEQLRLRATRFGWDIVAWTVLTNHYHILAIAPESGPGSMSQFVGQIHGATASAWNRDDAASGRKVWCNYWDTCITNERSFNARLNYIHWNAAKHGIVGHAIDYPFSSYRDYLQAHPDLLPIIERDHPFDRIRVPDNF